MERTLQLIQNLDDFIRFRFIIYVNYAYKYSIYIYFYKKRKKTIRMDVDELELILGQKSKYTKMIRLVTFNTTVDHTELFFSWFMRNSFFVRKLFYLLIYLTNWLRARWREIERKQNHFWMCTLKWDRIIKLRMITSKWRKKKKNDCIM